MAHIQSLSRYQADPAHTVCFSGHRPKGLGFRYNSSAYRKASYVTMQMDLMQDLSKLVIDHKITRFITGGAQGWDQLCFQAVENLRKFMPGYPIQNIVFIPFYGQESRWMSFGLFGQEEYRQMLEKADAVYAVHDAYSPNYKTTCIWLNDRNNAMVDVSGICVFPELFGTPLETRKGGTRNCYDYAMKKGIAIQKFIYDITDQDMLRKHI